MTVFRSAATALALAFSAAFAFEAAASFPPKRFTATPEEIAARCAALGTRVSYEMWEMKPGEYGCGDTALRTLILCKPDGACKLYWNVRLPKERKARAI